VSQYSIEGLPRCIGHDVLILNTAVRRFDNNSDRPAAPAANLDKVN